MAEILYDDTGEPVTVAVIGSAPTAPTATRGYVGVAIDGGGLARFVASDTAGRQVVVGPAANGVAVVGNPVLTAGSDGTNVRIPLMDTSGRQRVVGAADQAAAAAGSPVRVAGWDGTNIRTLEQRNGHPAAGDYGLVTRDIERTVPTYFVLYDRMLLVNVGPPTSNKTHVGTLFNTSSTRKVVIQRIWVINWQFDPLQGGDVDLELWKISARSGGTSLNIRSEDSADTLSSGIVAHTDPTSVTQDYLLRRVMSTSDEVTFGGSQYKTQMAIPMNALQYERRRGQRGLTLRQNQGVSLKWTGQGDGDGTVSMVIEFTDEVA